MKHGITCSIKQNSNYSAAVKALSQNDRVIDQFKQNPSFDGIHSLTKDEQLVLVNEAINVAEDEKIKNKLLKFREELLQTPPRIFSENVLSPDFAIKPQSPSAFLKFLSNELNQEVYKMLEQEIYRATEVDLLAGVVVGADEEQINNRLLDLKKRLIAKLYAYCYGNSGLFDLKPNQVSYKEFKKLLATAEEKIRQEINLRGGKITDKSSSVLRVNVLQPIAALILLGNFDNLVEILSHHSIASKPDYRNEFAADGNKWELTHNDYYEASFLDGFQQVSGEKTTPNRLKTAISQIPVDQYGNTFSPEIIRQIITNVKHLYQDTKSDKYIDKFFETVRTGNAEAQKKAFLDMLQNSDFLHSRCIGKNGFAALHEWLSQYDAAYNKSIPQSGEKRAEFERSRDLLGAFITTVVSQDTTAYISTTEEGNEISANYDRAQRKVSIYEGITSKAKENRRLGLDGVYMRNFEIANGQTLATITSVYSDAAIRALTSMFGISFKNPAVQNIFSSAENLKLLGLMCQKIQDLYIKYFGTVDFSNDDELNNAAKKFQEELVFDPIFMQFSDQLVDTQHTQLHDIKDQNLNTLPGEQIHSLVSDFKTNLEDFKKAFTGYNGVGVRNILLHRELLQSSSLFNKNKNAFSRHSCYRADVLIKDARGNSVIVPPVLMEPEEQLAVSLNYDFAHSIAKNRVFYLQVAEYSDKPRIPLMAYNFDRPIQLVLPGGKGLAYYHIYALTPDQLKVLYQQQSSDYYAAVQNKIVEKYRVVFGVNFQTLREVSKYLEDNQITETDLHDIVAQYQSNGNAINFIKDADYITDAAGRIYINPSLQMKVAAIYNEAVFNQLYDDGEQAFLKNIEQEKQPIRIMLNLDKMPDEEKITLCELLGLGYSIDKGTGAFSSQQLSDFVATGAWNAKDASGNLVHKAILQKYYAMQQLFKDAESQIGLRMPWVHDLGDKGVHLSTAEIDALYDGNSKIVKEILTKDLSQRYIKGTKRNSAGVTTFIPMDVNDKHGVAESMRVSMVEFPKYATKSHFTDTAHGKDALKPHDGSSHTNGIFAYWEEHSYRGHTYEGSKKTIGIIQTDYGITQVKHADYVMTNEWIRRSFHNPNGMLDESQFNGDQMMRAMLTPCKLTQDFYINFEKNEALKDPIKFHYPIYAFNGRYAQLTKIDVDAKNRRMKFEWTYLDDSTIVPSQLSTQLVPEALVTDDGWITIDNVYQLWKAFGGAEAMEELENGAIDFTEKNNATIAQMISEFDTTRLMKKTMIAKIIDPESVKSGQINRNKSKDLISGKLTFAEINSNSFGIQQDYTHESLDARIPALTQVITAIAFNGHNQRLVQNAYEALGRIIENSIRPLLTLNGKLDKNDLNRYLGEKLIRALQKNSVASTATDLVLSYLEDLSREGILPYSHHDLFYKVSSDIISSLNRDTIKQTFAGIAVIQAPSQGIVGLYEDVNGKKYTRSDILKSAYAKYRDSLSQDVLESADALIQRYLQSEPQFGENGKVLITEENAHLLGIGDVVEEDGQTVRINHPNVLVARLKKIHEGQAVIKRLDYQRDLKTTNITWKEIDKSGRVVSVNLFETAASALMLSDDPVQAQLGRLWHNLNLKFLKQGFYFKTFEQFQNYVKSGKVDYKKCQQIQPNSFIHTFGEQVIPKVHTAFKTGNSSLSEIRDNEQYFEARLRKTLLVASELQPTDVGIVTEGGEIVLTQNTLDQNQINTRIEYDEISRKLCVKDLSGRILCYITDNVTYDKDRGVYVAFDKYNKEKAQYTVSDFQAIIEYANDKPTLTIFIAPKNNVSRNNQYYDAIKAIDDPREKHINNIKLGSAINPNDLRINRFRHGVINGKTDAENIALHSRAIYNSWRTQLFTVSARIPSQSYQSFLPTETVAYTENNLNIGYMNIWEMWFQGSDFDIDKAYTLMYGVSKSGKIQGNAFTDYSSVESIQESLKLPIPKYILNDHSVSDAVANNIEDNTDDILTVLEKSWEEIANIIFDTSTENIKQKYLTIAQLIDTVNALEKVDLIGDIDEDLNSDDIEIHSRGLVLQKLLEYQREGQVGLKNRIAQAILTQASDLENLESSEKPMSMSPVTTKITEVLKRNWIEAGKDPNDFSEDEYYAEYDPYTIFRIQRNNSVGKEDVGISANGVKAAGAIQQYFNTRYREITVGDIKEKSPEYQRVRVNATLEFDTKGATGRKIGSFSFFKLANTRVSNFEQFEALLDDYCTNEFGAIDYNKHQLYTVYQFLTASDKNTYLNDENIPDYVKQAEYVYRAYKRIHNKKTPSFVEFLYFAQNFEENVADTISIFISMATDNAKELALAKIHGIPDLLSIPLAMITLGIDIKTVVDVCVNILGDVADDIQKNRFENAKKSNVRNAIALLREKGYNQQTVSSLLFIYDFAQELKSITGFFKVNQGVETKYADLSAWLYTMAQDRYRKAVDRNINYAQYTIVENGEVHGLTKEDLTKPLNYRQLFIQGSEEQQSILQQYDISKTIVNVMDVVVTSPHFSAQLKSAGEIVDLFTNICGKAYVVSQLLKTTTGDDEDVPFKLESEDFDTKVDRSDLTSKTIRLIDHWVITQYLNSTRGLTLNASDIKTQFPHLLRRTRGAITLNNIKGIKEFLAIMNEGIIPKLESDFGTNTFVSGLVRTIDKDSGLTYYDFAYDPYAVKDNPTLMENYNMALEEFELIKNMGSGIRSNTGHEFTIGELLYLYSVITGKGYTRGLYTIVGQVAKDSPLLNHGIENVYKSLDYSVQHKDDPRANSNTPNGQDALQSIVLFLEPYVVALASPKKTKSFNVDGVTRELALKEEFLYTLNELSTANIPIGNNGTVIAYRLMSEIPFTKDITVTQVGNVVGPNSDGLYTATYHVQFKVYNERGASITSPGTGSNEFTYQISFADLQNPVISASTYATIKADIQNWVSGVQQTFINPEYQKALGEKKTLKDLFSDTLITQHLPKVIQDFYSGAKSILVTKGTESNYIQSINGRQLLVIDESHLVGKDASMYLVDLYLQSLPDNPTSENQKIAALLQLVSGTPVPEFGLDEQYLSQILQTVKDSGYKKLVNDYIDFIAEHSKERSLINVAQIALATYESTLRNKWSYYIQVGKDGADFEVGDLIQTKAGEKLCIYRDINGTCWFVSTRMQAGQNKILEKYTPDSEEITEIYKLVTNPEIKLGVLSEDSFIYGVNSAMQVTYNDLLVGDQITDKSFGTGIVTDIVYFPIPDKNSKQQKTGKRVIVAPLKGSNKQGYVLTWCNGRWYKQTNGARYPKLLQDISAEGKPLNIKRAEGNQNVPIGIPYTLDDIIVPEIDTYLRSRIQIGTYVKYDNQWARVLERNGDTIYTTNFAIPVTSVKEVVFNNIDLDPDFFFEQLQPKKFWYKTGTNIIPYRPDISHGYLVISTTEKVNKKSAKEEWTVSVGVKNINDVNYPEIPISKDLVQVDANQPIAEGDVFIEYGVNEVKNGQATKGVTVVSKVVQVLKDGFILARKSYVLNTEKIQEKTHISLKVDEDFDGYVFTKGTIYNASPNSVVERYTSKENAIQMTNWLDFYRKTNDSDACANLLSNLQHQLGRPIIIERFASNSNVFAYVDESGIHINMSKKPDNTTDAAYIMSQTIHEFTHIVLAKLRADAPTAYYEFVKAAIVWADANNITIHTTGLDQEEIVVRYLEESFKQNLDSDLSINEGLMNAFDKYKQTLQDIFGIAACNLDDDSVLSEYLRRYKSVNYFAQPMDVDSIRRNAIAEKVFDKITRKC